MAKNGKVLWVTIPLLVICIILLGAGEVMAQDPTADPASWIKVLSSGSAQAVLSAICLALLTAVVWQAKVMRKIQDDRVSEIHALLTDTVTKCTEALTASAEGNRQNAEATHRVATVIDKCDRAHTG